MSFDAVRWALAQRVPKSSAKFVLVAMADCVNGDGADMVCWPSYRHLTDRTGQDVKTVEAGLRRLREAGFILDTGKRRGSTGRVVVYQLKTPENGAVLSLDQPDDLRDEVSANAPEIGAVDTAGNPPGFPSKTPVFPDQSPQISQPIPPKLGDGTSNGTRKGTRKEPGRSAGALAIPGVPTDLLTDYLAVRKAKHAGPLTETALRGLQREAEKAGISLAEAITACCEFGWQGFNAGWYAERAAKAGRRPALNEPAWRAEQRQRTQTAAPGVAIRHEPAADFFEAEPVVRRLN